MAERRRPVTTFLVGMTALAALLVIVGLRVQYAVISTPPPPAAPAPTAPVQHIPTTTEQCETVLARDYGAQPSLPPTISRERHVALELARPAGAPRGADPELRSSLFTVLITPEGGAHTVWPISGQFDGAVLEALGRARYEPAMVSGKPVPICAVVTPTVRWK